MAANQQLKDYIDQQAKVGVSKGVIKSALLEAGWQESDINEAMAGFESSSPSVGTARPVEIAKPAEIKPIGIKPSGSGPQEKASPVSFVTSDIFQKKNEPMFESKGTVAQTSFLGNKPQVVSTMKGMNFFQKPIVPIILGALSLLFVAVAGIFYMQNNSLQTKLDSVNQENESLNTKLNSLTSDKNGLTGQITSLNQIVNDLSNQLSIFAWPSNVSQTQELPITIKGILGGGGRALYWLTTNKDILVTVKNSKNPNVDGALKPLLGNQVEVSGTHLVKSDSITVTAVNGTPLASLQSTSTSGGAGTTQ